MKYKIKDNGAWIPGELWIPFCDENRHSQEAFMESLLHRGDFMYADACRIHTDDGYKKFWILRRISIKSTDEIVNAPQLDADHVEEDKPVCEVTNAPEVNSNGHNDDEEKDPALLDELQEVERQPLFQIGTSKVRAARRRVTDPEPICRICMRRCKQQRIPNGSFICHKRMLGK